MSVSCRPNAHLGAVRKTYGVGGGEGGVGTARNEGKHGTREPRGLEALISETATWFPASVRKTYGRPTALSGSSGSLLASRGRPTGEEGGGGFFVCSSYACPRREKFEGFIIAIYSN